MRWIAAAVAIAAFLGAVPAVAQSAAFPPRLNFAYDLAVDYWGQEPTACSSVDRQIVPPGSLGNPRIGAISGDSTHVEADAAPGSVDCFLWIDRAYAEPIIFDLLCAVMVHNVGHLLGLGYSPDPRNPMHERIPVPELCDVKGQQSARLYLLRMRYHWLQPRTGSKVERLRRRLHSELSVVAERFWSIP